MRSRPVTTHMLLIVIESIEHIMRHRQVMAPGFPIHSNNTSESTKGLTKFFGFSCPSLATWDFGTTNKFRAGGNSSESREGGHTATSNQVRKVVGAGIAPTL